MVPTPRSSTYPLHPEGPSRILQAQWHMGPKPVGITKDHMAAEQSNFERDIELQKGSKHVLFVPRPAFSQPRERVFERWEDVVNMHYRAWRQPGQNLEE